MKKLFTCAVLLMFSGFGLNVSAQQEGQELGKAPQASTPAELRTKYENMTDEEREAWRAEMRAKRESMTDEERAAMKAERKARMESMTDEERAAHKAKRRAHWESLSEEEKAAMRENRNHGKQGHKGKKHKQKDKE